MLKILGEATSNDSLCWADGNQISIVSDEGIYLLVRYACMYKSVTISQLPLAPTITLLAHIASPANVFQDRLNEPKFGRPERFARVVWSPSSVGRRGSPILLASTTEDRVALIYSDRLKPYCRFFDLVSWLNQACNLKLSGITFTWSLLHSDLSFIVMGDCTGRIHFIQHGQDCKKGIDENLHYLGSFHAHDAPLQHVAALSPGKGDSKQNVFRMASTDASGCVKLWSCEINHNQKVVSTAVACLMPSYGVPVHMIKYYSSENVDFVLVIHSQLIRVFKINFAQTDVGTVQYLLSTSSCMNYGSVVANTKCDRIIAVTLDGKIFIFDWNGNMFLQSQYLQEKLVEAFVRSTVNVEHPDVDEGGGVANAVKKTNQIIFPDGTKPQFAGASLSVCGTKIMILYSTKLYGYRKVSDKYRQLTVASICVPEVKLDISASFALPQKLAWDIYDQDVDSVHEQILTLVKMAIDSQKSMFIIKLAGYLILRHSCYSDDVKHYVTIQLKLMDLNTISEQRYLSSHCRKFLDHYKRAQCVMMSATELGRILVLSNFSWKPDIIPDCEDKCSICCAAIPLDIPILAKCVSGHSFYRCVKTLKVIDNPVGSFKCSGCSLKCLGDLKENTLDNCCYCGDVFEPVFYDGS